MSSFPRRPRRYGARHSLIFLLTSVPALSACSGLSEAMTAHTDVVARAGSRELSVEDAASLLALNPEIPAEPQVVQALAELWLDYSLLATAVAEDSTLESVDMDAFVAPAREQAIVLKLREQVITADTVFTDAQLAERWAVEGPGAEIRARHILLRVPTEATPAQRDSVRAFAESLGQRARGGEDFAALARQFSVDGSAADGGDLGYFGRGRMVAPFEEAAFALEPGQVSPAVESPFGFHVIKVEDRRQTEMGEQREEFRQYMVATATEGAETAYLDSLSAAASLEIPEGALATVKEIAGDPAANLSGRAARREIATYEGGEFTAGEFLAFIRTQPGQVQSMFTTASDEQLQSAIEQLARKELLLREAERRSITLSQPELDSIRSDAREAIRIVVEQSGIAAAARQNPSAESMATHIMGLLRGYLTGQVQLVPLSQLGYILRDLYPGEINSAAFPPVVERVTEIRATQPAPMMSPDGMVPPGAPGSPQADPMATPEPTPPTP